MAKLPPLADVTSVDGINYVFDPTKVLVVYVMPLVRFELPRVLTTGLPGIAVQQQSTELEFKLESIGPATTHVWGVVTLPVPIPDKPLDFLNRLKLADKFVLLTSLAGEIRIKATAISWLLPRYPGVTDPRVHCALSLGGSSTNIFQIIEDVPTVRARTDAIRTKTDEG